MGEPAVYNKGMIDGFKQVIRKEGMMALSTGAGPTAVGYFIQGWFKFGGVELVKINLAQRLGPQGAWDNRFVINLVAAACAEFVADVFLCPLEATRIKLVANPSYASGLLDGMPKVMRDEGVLTGFYSGFGPILFKQIPYTMAKFAVQGAAADQIYASMGTSPAKMTPSGNVGVSLASGTIAGVIAT